MLHLCYTAITIFIWDRDMGFRQNTLVYWVVVCVCQRWSTASCGSWRSVTQNGTVVAGKVHWFGVCGIANGLAIMADEETRTLWDHITGEAVEGSLAGSGLAVWPISLTTVGAAASDHPDLELLVSRYRSPVQWFFDRVNRNKISGKGFFPLPAVRSMEKRVDRDARNRALRLHRIYGLWFFNSNLRWCH